MKRIQIITGASSGIGREFALQMARNRKADEIWLVARRRDRLENLAAEIALIDGAAKPLVVEIDISGKAGATKLAKILEREGQSGDLTIDALINNAGFGTYGPFADTPLEKELEMIDLNITSLTALCHHALPYLASGSLVVNVASLAGFIPLGNFAVYAASKAYVLSFSVALAAELADRKIFVSTVCPGPVDTEFALVASSGAREKVVDGKSAEAVVRACLADAQRGKRISVMAWKWKFKAFMSRFVGRYWFARHTFVHEKRPSRSDGV